MPRTPTTRPARPSSSVPRTRRSPASRRPGVAAAVTPRRTRHLALLTRKPATLHCRSAIGQRDAQDALLSELQAFGSDPPAVIIHSFSDPLDYAEATLELGATTRSSGLVFRAGEEASADVARLTPPDRILVETDSPFLSPPGSP